MATGDEPRVITVSREALRAELAEFELRMRDYLDMKLKLYALQKDLDTLRQDGSVAAQSLERGEIPAALRDAIKIVIDDEYAKRVKENTGRLDSQGQDIEILKGWRNRLLGAFALAMFVIPVIATATWHFYG